MVTSGILIALKRRANALRARLSPSRFKILGSLGRVKPSARGSLDGPGLIRCLRGTAAIEFALLAPVLMLLALGGFEMTRFIIIQQKISKTVNTMGDLFSQSPSLSESDFTNMWPAVAQLMSPYNSDANTIVIVSNVSNNGTANKVNWQRKGGGTYIANSKIGAVAATATLPAGFTLAVNEDTIITEEYYNFKPLIAPNIVGAQVLYKVKYYKPRLAALTVITP